MSAVTKAGFVGQTYVEVVVFCTFVGASVDCVLAVVGTHYIVDEGSRLLELQFWHARYVFPRNEVS